MDLSSVFSEILNEMLAYGYFGSFIVSFLGSLIPFLPIPYLIPVILLSMKLDPLFVGLMSGIGGGIGKITSYLVGRSFRAFLSDDRKRKLSYFNNLIDKHGALAVFLFALTPLPDDVIYIPIGIVGYRFIKFFIANATGKVILAIFVAYLGRYYFEIAKIFVDESGSYIPILIAMVFMIFISILLIRMDWESFITIYRKGGLRAVILNLSYLTGLSKQRSTRNV